MPIRERQVAASDGRIFIEGRDLETGDLLFRRPREAKRQPPKVQRAMEARDEFDDWQMWTITRQEFERRNPAPRGPVLEAIFSALSNREDAAWTEYLQALNRWRTA